nr:helix-turn-helix transcriptional regulator [uncultured Acetatifactor sp.]
MSIGENIKKCRTEIGLSQKELGKKLGVSQAMIAQYEKGKRIPKMETVSKIASALGVTLTEIYSNLSVTDMEKLFTEEERKQLRQGMSSGKTFLQRHELLNLFSALNDCGKEKAIERVSELTEIKKYRKEE